MVERFFEVYIYMCAHFVFFSHQRSAHLRQKSVAHCTFHFQILISCVKIISYYIIFYNVSIHIFGKSSVSVILFH